MADMHPRPQKYVVQHHIEFGTPYGPNKVRDGCATKMDTKTLIKVESLGGQTKNAKRKGGNCNEREANKLDVGA
jgi:hypothetical protein